MMPKKSRKRKLKGVMPPRPEDYRKPTPTLDPGMATKRIGAETILDVLSSLRSPLPKQRK